MNREIIVEYTANFAVYMKMIISIHSKDRQIIKGEGGRGEVKSRVMPDPNQDDDDIVIKDGTAILGMLGRLALIVNETEQGEQKEMLMEKVRMLYDYTSAKVVNHVANHTPGSDSTEDLIKNVN